MIWSPNIETIESGNVAVSNFPAVQPVSDNAGSLTVDAVDLDIRNLSSGTDSVTVTGTVATAPSSAATATVTSVSVSPTVATLAASNASRLKLIVHNESGTLFVKLGTGATSASYSYRLVANTNLEITQYTGEVTAIKATGTSNALVTEL
jgi:hypothetical protein